MEYVRFLGFIVVGNFDVPIPSNRLEAHIIKSFEDMNMEFNKSDAHNESSLTDYIYEIVNKDAFFLYAIPTLYVLCAVTILANIFVMVLIIAIPVQNVAILISICSIACIAIDRYIALVWAPMRYHLIVTRKSCTIAVLVVIISQTSVALFLFLYCGWCSHVMLIVISLYIAVNTTLYITIYKSIHNYRMKVPRLKHTFRESKRLLGTFSIIVGVLILTWGMVCSVCLILYYKGILSNTYTYMSIIIYYLSYCLTTINSLANPIIYWFRLTEFQKAVKDTSCLKC
ncbi:melanocortin receptor 4-like [Anneissia japonica]|uniref:melanocortin receptor 4-like n=1 Tax=Anneissia japonica TaxID=1529436 RepID=UPI0014255866|nr:melanocortin receptor 4-like [Anneissia japonica]